MMDRKEFVSLLQAICSSIDKLTEEQYRALLKGDGRLEYKQGEKKVAKSASVEKKLKSEELGEAKRAELVEELFKLSDRTAAIQWLAQLDLSRHSLSKIAEMLNIHITKRDTKEKIVQKIVEAGVGVRLRTEAIKDTDLKRTSIKLS